MTLEAYGGFGPMVWIMYDHVALGKGIRLAGRVLFRVSDL